MTLHEALTKVAKRCEVDLDSEVDTSDLVALADAFAVSARRVSRETYFLFTDNATLTLTEDEPKYDLLDSDICSYPVFDCRRVHINGVWLPETRWVDFVDSYTTYFSDDSAASISLYVPFMPSSIRLYPAPNSTAVAATDNFVVGYYLHPTYTYSAYKDTELLGPEEFHDAMVRECALDITEAYFEANGGSEKWTLMAERNAKMKEEWKIQNLNQFSPAQRQGALGRTRRIIGIGDLV